METNVSNLSRRERRAIARMNAAEGNVCQLTELLFEVEKRENPMPANSEYSHLIIGQLPSEQYPEGGDFFLNACSNRYALVPNAEIFPQIEAILNSKGIRYSVTYRHIDMVRFYAEYRILDDRYAYTMKGTTGDKIHPVIRVQHSYNGLTKYKIIVGYFRVICSNGLVIAIEEMKKFNLVLVGKHTESVRRSLQELNVMLNMFVNEAEQMTSALTAKYEILASIDYAGGSMVQSVRDRVTEVLKVAKIPVVEEKNYKTIDTIYNTVIKESNDERGLRGTVTDWMIYNAINAYIYDPARTAAEPEKKMELDSKVFEYMLKHNKKAAIAEPATV